VVAEGMASLTSSAPDGAQPAPIPLAVVIRSGVTPDCCIAHHVPERPLPLMTSSAMKVTPWRSQISRMRRQ
jgi:hypothetical protein